MPRHRPEPVLPRTRPERRARLADQCPVPGCSPAWSEYAITNRIVDGIWGGLTGRERRTPQSAWVQAARRERDRAILAADAAGDAAEVIGRSFGLSRMTVTRIVRAGNHNARTEP